MTKDPTTELGAPAGTAPHELRWFGHPRGLSTLFFTELWERFSYYGMRGILILFMAAGVAEGGLDFSDGTAAAVYGMYTAMVYLLALPGGWVADNLWGQRKAVFVGGCIIAAGHFSMAMPAFGLPELPFFFGGLILIVTGTGLLKPNVSTIVGELYPEGGARRDAGFSVFYMGINLGAFAGPLVCGWLGEGYSWHWGFSAAGFGMVLGLIQYKFGEKYLGKSGLLASGDSPQVTAGKARNFYLVLVGAIAAVALFAFLVYSGVVAAGLQEIATWLGYGILLLVVLFFTYLIFNTAWAGGILAFFVVGVVALLGNMEHLDAGRYAVAATVVLFIVLNLVNLALRGAKVTTEKRRLLVIFWLFLLAAIFWSGFEQAGSSMNLFADRDTDRVFGPYGVGSLVTVSEVAPDAEAGVDAAAAEVFALTGSGNAIVLLLTAIVAAFLGWVCFKVWKRRDLLSFDRGLIAVVAVGITAFCWWIFRQLFVGWEMPTSWLQSINPLFIITLAPVFGVLWTWLASRRVNPPIPVKFALGLIGLAAGFFVLAWGAANADDGTLLSPAWLVVTYFLHTCGELCLSPVGLSSMTKLAPTGRVGQMMGVWFIASALGNLIAGLVAGQIENLPSQQLFWYVALFVGGAGTVALLLSPFVRKLMGDVR